MPKILGGDLLTLRSLLSFHCPFCRVVLCSRALHGTSVTFGASSVVGYTVAFLEDDVEETFHFGHTYCHNCGKKCPNPVPMEKGKKSVRLGTKLKVLN